MKGALALLVLVAAGCGRGAPVKEATMTPVQAPAPVAAGFQTATFAVG